MSSRKSRLTRHCANLLLFCIGFGLSGALRPASAQEPSDSLASLLAYACTFDANTQTLQINAAVNDENGLPFETNAFPLSAVINGADPASSDSIADAVTFSSLVPRAPLRMVLVLDITDTIPIDNIVSALSEDFIAQLQPNDELALITVGDQVSPATRFFTDKTRLIDEYLVGLETIGGDNRVYDAVMTATDLFPFDADTRQVILVVTDSGRRENITQATNDAIVEQASADGTQIYSIGFNSEDRPDAAELRALAVGTGGFSWFYGETPNTPASIESAVRSALQDFVRLLDSEISITLDVTGVAATPNNLLPITLSADVPALEILTSQIACPYEVIAYSIAFTGSASQFPIRGQTDIGVRVSPNENDASVVFRVDGNVVQNSAETIYTLDAAQLAPGDHVIEAQIWNRNNETLATTDAPLTVFTQQTLEVSIDGGATDALDGAVEFGVNGNPDFSLPSIELLVETTSSLAPLSLGIAQTVSDSRATLRIEDITELAQVFPGSANGEPLQVFAVAANPEAGSPPLALSDRLAITLAAVNNAEGINDAIDDVSSTNNSPSTTTNPPTASAIVPLAYDNLFANLPILATVFFGALNIILFRAVRKSRIRRLIAHPDHHDLSPEVMSLTLYRGGVPHAYTLTKKTVTVGRGSTNDINLGEDPNISRQHGVVMWRRNDWYYSNRKRRLITRINRRKYRGLMFHRLEPMTELQLGNATMVFHSNAQQDVLDYIKTDL